MSKRSIDFFVLDIFVAILKIEQTVSKFDSSQDLLHSYTNWDSIIREFEIIGEASKYLLKEGVLPNEERAVVDFRNVIIHEYFGIDADEVWDIIHEDLKAFKKSIIAIIDQYGYHAKNELIDAFIDDNLYLDFVVKALEELRGDAYGVKFNLGFAKISRSTKKIKSGQGKS